MIYTDDATLLFNIEAELEKLVNSVKEHSENSSLHMNVRQRSWTLIRSHETLVCSGGERIENVSSFEYLGSLISPDGDCSKEVKRRLSMSSTRLQELRNLYKRSNIETKLEVIPSCLFPIASYGCEAWTFSKSIIRRIYAFEIKRYRTIILGTHWSKSMIMLPQELE